MRTLKDDLERIIEVGKGIRHSFRPIKNKGKTALVSFSIVTLIALGAYASQTARQQHQQQIPTEYASQSPGAMQQSLMDDASQGKLEVENDVPGLSTDWICTIVHRPGASEGYDKFDNVYSPLFDPSGINSKIVSVVDANELTLDTRASESRTPINLELSLHSQSGQPVHLSSGNSLICTLPFAGSPHFYDFGNKPITYWERDLEHPNVHYLISNIRKEILQNGGVIPLPDLNGTYSSEEVYLNAQIRFDTPFVHLNDDNIADLKDYTIFANAFGRKGITNIHRGDPADKGAWADFDLDGDVDMADFRIFSDHYLTSKTYHLEYGWILE